MSILQLHHISVVVTDLEAAKVFFTELGMELEGEAPIEGRWVDRINSIDDLRCQIAMMKTPDGLGRLELTQFSNPPAISLDPAIAPPNALGLRSVMFAVDDIDATVARLQAVGGTLIGEIVQYEEIYRLCYMRGPAGIIVSLAESLGQD
ncbi:MAG: VOC family protein [Thermomicrobiales bacterium]|nr:VOC family protein [Thermomicrobiales bacterium]